MKSDGDDEKEYKEASRMRRQSHGRRRRSQREEEEKNWAVLRNGMKKLCEYKIQRLF